MKHLNGLEALLRFLLVHRRNLFQAGLVSIIIGIVVAVSHQGFAVQEQLAVYSPDVKGIKVSRTEKAAGTISITLAISPPELKEVTARDGKGYIQVNLAGCGNDNAPGGPALPIINHIVEVPWGTQVTAEATGQNFREMSVPTRIYPHQPPIPKVPGPAGNPPFLVNEEFYSGPKSDSFQVAAGADRAVVRTFRKRGHHLAKITVRPFEYNPAKGLLRYPVEVVLKVTYTGELPKAAGPRLGTISVVEVTVPNRQELDELIQAGYDISNVRGNVVTIYATQQEVQALQAAGYQPVEIEVQPQPRWEPGAPGKKGLGVYHNYASLTTELEAYAAAYPDICRLISLGTSVQGRELWAMKITDNPDVEEDEPEFKYVSTIHGNEPIGTEMCLYFIDLLLTNYGSDSRITQLVDATEIWIVPLMNPDGLELGSRYNANGYDLNRSFPEGSSYDFTDIFGGPYNNTAGRPPEVAHVMRWSQGHSFALSANFHTGALVVNYPYDNDGLGSTDSPTPDDLLFEDISRRYSYHNTPMWNSTIFPDGITNGAAWYVINGGMQDWNYRYLSNNEVTIELSNLNSPPESELPNYWSDNQESMLTYLEAMHIGIRGIVTDNVTGQPIWARIQVEGIDHPVFTDPDIGDYYRMLLPGTYSLLISAPGYKRTIIPGVLVTDGPATRVDVALQPAQGSIIVVTHDSLAAGAAEYVAQKQSEGYEVYTITLTGSPTANYVRDQIITVYNTSYADFVVIIGDIDKVPTFYSGGDASDLLYGLMDPGEGFADYLGKETVVGRISLDTNAQISDYVSKLASFVQADQHNDITWVSGGGDTWQYDVCEQSHDWVIEYCISPDVSNELFYESTGSASALTAHINGGTDAVIYSGHASETGWSRYDYDLSDLQLLTNYLDSPIVFGHCCLTASIQVDNCFAEQWVDTSARALVYIGGSDSTYWIEDDVMEKGEFLAMSLDPGVAIAYAIDAGLERVDDMCPFSAQYYYTIYQVIGDPTVRLFEVPGPGLGQLRLDRTAYSCLATAAIDLQDYDRAGSGTVEVEVASTSEPTSETVILTETPLGSARFLGSIQTDSGTPTPDGKIQVAHGDSIVVAYYDPDDGTGSPGMVYAMANVDCEPPFFAGLESATPAAGYVDLAWNLATDANGPIKYNIYRDQTAGGSIGTLIGSTANIHYRDSTVTANQTYYYVVRAEDAAGNEETNTVEWSATLPNCIIIGTGLGSWNYPMSTYYEDARTQVIYLASEIGQPCRITSLGLDVTTIPGQTMNNWTIRIKHTTMSSYPASPAWEGTGWTTVYQANETISSTGWVTFEFPTPFDYNGSDNLLIDFSYNNSSWTEDGECGYSTPGGTRTIYYRTDSGFGNPLTWSGTTNPSPNSTTNVPNIILCLESFAPNCTPIPVATWEFQPPPENWSYRTAAPPPDIPAWSHATSTMVTGPLSAIGLTATAGETTDYYGSWDNYSGDPDTPTIPWVDNSVWRAIYTMSSSKSDPDTVPSIRLRFGLQHMKATSYIQLNPGGWVPLTQLGMSNTEYKLYLRPPIVDNGFFLAFDLIDFGQPYGTPCDGTAYLEEVVVDRFDLADPCFDDNWTIVTAYSGTELHSWTHSTAGVDYLTNVDSYTSTTEGLEQATTMAQTRTFGAWTSPTNEIDLIPDQLYRAIWTLTCEDSTLGGAQRIRMHTNDFRYSSYMVIDRSITPGESALPPSTGRDYYIYAELPGTPTVDNFLLAWDLFDFDPAAGGWAELTNISVSRRDIP